MDIKETLANFGNALMKDPVLILIIILVAAKATGVF